MAAIKIGTDFDGLMPRTADGPPTTRDVSSERSTWLFARTAETCTRRITARLSGRPTTRL